ncbi:MAG TPA: glycosyltransferase family 4 protein [Pyrinomonadaceae bacterium]
MKKTAQNLKILVGMPEKTARGGINACEPPFLRELERLGAAVREEIYTFDNAAETPLWRRVRQVWKTAFKFRRLLRADDFDVLHLNTAFDRKSILRDAFSLFWLKNGKTKIFLKFHGAEVELLPASNFALSLLIRYLINAANGVGVLSSEEKRGFVDLGFPAEKFFVVKNALPGFPQESFPPVENFPAGSATRLLFASRLIPTKGLIETVRAVSILREKKINVVLDVLGDGETRAPAERLAKSLGIGEFVVFHGHVAEKTVHEFYRAGGVLVFPTFHAEGFPMVIFNALPFGLPIVTTRIRAAADYLKEGENALFCEPKNPASVAEKVAEITQNKELRLRMGEHNRALAEEFTAEKIAPEYLEIFRRIA